LKAVIASKNQNSKSVCPILSSNALPLTSVSMSAAMQKLNRLTKVSPRNWKSFRSSASAGDQALVTVVQAHSVATYALDLKRKKELEKE
jgi:hypothetical protein